MPKHGKKYRDAYARIDRESEYDFTQGVNLCKSVATAKFDETIDAAFNLNVNPRHADQMVRGSVVLPNGTGKATRVAVFAKGEKATEAEEAGADIVGADELVQRVTDGFLDFDVTVATPDMMGQVGRIGRVLGPRGLMPNPKVGTVTTDVETAVRNAKAGQVQFRTDKAGIIHSTIGKADFETDSLKGNLTALINELFKIKPPAAKGQYLKKVAVSTTMGPGVTVDTGTLGL